MDNRLYLYGQLGVLLEHLPLDASFHDGRYLLYAPKNCELLKSDIYCAIFLYLHADYDDFEPAFAVKHELDEVAEIETIKTILKNFYRSHEQKNTTPEEKVEAIQYYLDHDAFIDDQQ